MERMIVMTRITFFHMYSQPSALRMDLFRSTSGSPPSSVPAGQINTEVRCTLSHNIHQKQWKQDHKYCKNHIFQLTKQLVAFECADFLRKRNLIQQILNQSEGTEKTADQPSHHSSDEDKKSHHIISHFEIPAPYHSLKRTDRTGTNSTGAGIAVQAGTQAFSICLCKFCL